MRGTRSKKWFRWAMALLVLVLVACTGADDAAGPTSAEADAATASTAAPSTNDEPVASQPRATDAEDGGVVRERTPEATTMLELLDRLPFSVYESASEGPSVQVELVDYGAVAELTGLVRPVADDTEAALDWIVSVSTDVPGTPGFAILPSSFLDQRAALRPAEVAEEIGFSLLDVDQASVISAPPVSFSVVSGDALALAPDLVDLGNGVVTAGEGDDYTTDIDSVTAARPIGRPLRLADRNGLIGASTSTPAIESFVAGAPSMLTVADLALAAEALDTAGSVSALLLEADFRRLGPEVDQLEAAGVRLVSVPFATVGIGMTTIDDRAAVAVVYVFGDEAGAAVARPELDELWGSAPLLSRQGALVSDWFAVESVEVLGRTVLVTATVVDGSSTLRVPNMVFQQELVFVSP